MPVSVLILTRDEQVNLPGCLESLGWCDDIVVLDSHSRDRTTDIARHGGARVFQRHFDNYAAQRMHGLTEISYRYPWVLMLDADERVSIELRDEIALAVAQAPADVTLFRMRRKDFLFGRWIRRSSGYPTWFGRLARVGHIRIERPINEEYHTDGAIAQLRSHLHHYPFNKGFSEWISKHDRYSSMEAALMTTTADAFADTPTFSIDPQARRKALKRLVYRLPARPLLMFLALYIVRGGFLEGRAGLTFCSLRAWYEFMIDCKRRELKLRELCQPI